MKVSSLIKEINIPSVIGFNPKDCLGGNTKIAKDSFHGPGVKKVKGQTNKQKCYFAWHIAFIGL